MTRRETIKKIAREAREEAAGIRSSRLYRVTRLVNDYGWLIVLTIPLPGLWCLIALPLGLLLLAGIGVHVYLRLEADRLDEKERFMQVLFNYTQEEEDD